jgi:hypothetical protein
MGQRSSKFVGSPARNWARLVRKDGFGFLPRCLLRAGSSNTGTAVNSMVRGHVRSAFDEINVSFEAVTLGRHEVTMH